MKSRNRAENAALSVALLMTRRRTLFFKVPIIVTRRQHKQNKGAITMIDTIKIIGTVIGAGVFVFMAWAMIWVACAMSDQCWYNYTGQL
ncbi:hypothetical protein P109_gp05 [Pelagibacter phage HTVC109P]|nr:hypothetical protein P109_gp05 [Pelagibacter phage HTVC109P]